MRSLGRWELWHTLSSLNRLGLPWPTPSVMASDRRIRQGSSTGWHIEGETRSQPLGHSLKREPLTYLNSSERNLCSRILTQLYLASQDKMQKCSATPVRTGLSQALKSSCVHSQMQAWMHSVASRTHGAGIIRKFLKSLGVKRRLPMLWES